MEDIEIDLTLFKRYHRFWMSILLWAADIIGVWAGFWLAVQVRGIPELIYEADYQQIIILLILILSILFFRRRLYPAIGLHYIDEFKNIVEATAIAFLILILITFLAQTSLVYSRFVLLLAGALSIVLILFVRYYLRHLAIKFSLWGEPVVLIGAPSKTAPISEYFLKNLQIGYRPVLAIKPEVLDKKISDTARDKSFLGTNTKKPLTALILLDNLGDVYKLAEVYRPYFHSIIFIKDRLDSFALVNMQVVDLINVIGFEVRNELFSWTDRLAKRLIDIISSLVGIIVFSPLMALFALLIRLDSHGDVLFKQSRVGRHGRNFLMLKFRTMHHDAIRVFEDALTQDPALRQQWDVYQKIKNDPRVTRVGKLMRRFSIDELPQLFNVLAGHMSLVGPRPFLVDQAHLYGENIKYYKLVRPGMTGLWQVSGRNETTFAQRAYLDREYVERWSVWLDMYILFRTVKVVLFEKNFY